MSGGNEPAAGAPARPRSATVVLPAFDVAAALPTVLRDLAVAAYALRSRDIALDVLVLTDPSDESAAVAAATASALDLELTVQDAPAGAVGDAFLAGFASVVARGSADLVVTMDPNGRHDASQIPHLVDDLIAHGLDVVIGSRWTSGSGTPGLSPSRWVLGRLANLAFRTLTGTAGIADATTSFRVARREVVEHFEMTGSPVTSHSVQTEFVAMAVANGFRVGEAPIIYHPALGGGPGMQRDEIVAFATHLRGLRTRIDRTRQRRLSPSGRRFESEHFGAEDDLEQLGTAKHFFDWVLDEFDPYLKGRVLEVGAGRGTITRKLLDRYPDISLTALEPAANVFHDLESYAALHERVDAHHATLDELTPREQFDAVLYLNVLEHVEDDAHELEHAAEVLRPGGALLVFGPALERLYSDLDYKAGHYRRYDVDRLEALARDAGFDPVTCRYFDMFGVVPYYLVYTLLRHRGITGSTMWGYDRLVVPASRVIERLVGAPPIGKNVLLVATRR